MRQIIFFVLVLLNLIFPILTVQAEESFINQSCTNAGADYDTADLNMQIIQLFTIGQTSTLDLISLGLKAASESQVKARIDFYRVNPQEELLGQKYIAVSGTEIKNYTVSFGDILLSEGVYAIVIKGLHDNEHAYTIVPAGDCYPGGYMIVLDGARPDRDILFTVKTFSANTSQSNSSTLNPDNDPLDNQLSQSRNTTTSTPTNQSNPYSEKLKNDPEFQQEIALILQDIEAHRYQGGAFGLQGVVGRILTWPVFIGACFVLIVLICLIVLVTRTKSSQTKK